MPIDDEEPGEQLATQMRDRGRELGEFLMVYKFALDELATKVDILREEITFRQGTSPIEHVSSRLKTFDSLLAKAKRRGIDSTPEAVAAGIFDIAGMRLVCSFISDCYDVAEMLTSQRDIEVLEIKDYIAQPKDNGYRSLHLIVQLPVFLSTGPCPTPVEIQIRTVAMDFWASTEHKIYYKYDQAVPDHLSAQLTSAALSARELDETMQRLHLEVRGGGATWV